MRRTQLSVAVAVAALVALTLSACATPAGPGTIPEGVPTPTTTIVRGNEYAEAPAGPGAFRVRYATTELVLDPVTYCYGNGCADGVDPDPPSVGSPDELLVYVPVREFDDFTAQLHSGDDYCSGRWVTARSEPLGDGWWRIEPAGPADDYTVELFASGDGHGDMAATLRWTTTTDAGLPEPTASLTLIADHDGEPDSYGVELSVANLAESPAAASATITVTAAGGASHTFEAHQQTECVSEGSLYFDGPAADGLTAAALGDFPFEYRVELMIDGMSHVGTGIYPDDVENPQELAVPLTFTPALD